MSFFISDAWAQAGGAATEPNALVSFLPLIVLFIIFYFLLIRPQTKRAKEHKKMVEALAKGDEVVTNGGLLGRITEVGDNFITLQVGDGVELKIQRQAVASLMPKGTIKSS
ncbi:MAG TPA: preprotein translocase subunit YajC [Gammaproteobacteria bacterium]|nr:preprotein translocase subunit YajC [Gammaproteobacteria bacterium]